MIWGLPDSQLAGQVRWGRGGGADHPPGAPPPPAPCTPPPPPIPGQGDCFRLLQEGTRAPRLHALQLFPSCPAPPQRQLGERLGAGSGAQLLGSGAGTGEGGDMKEPGPAGVAGEGSPQAVASLRAPHIWPTGAVSGEGRRAPLLTTQPCLEWGGAITSPEGGDGRARPGGGCESNISESERLAEGGTGRACGCERYLECAG